jgi:hypothetical protein
MGKRLLRTGGGACLQPAEQVGGLLAVLFAEVRDQSLVPLHMELAGCRHLPAKGRGDYSHSRQELARLCKNIRKAGQPCASSGGSDVMRIVKALERTFPRRVSRSGPEGRVSAQQGRVVSAQPVKPRRRRPSLEIPASLPPSCTWRINQSCTWRRSSTCCRNPCCTRRMWHPGLCTWSTGACASCS